jgi:hypothetical protein
LSWFGSRVEGEEGDDVGGIGEENEVIMIEKRRMGSNGFIV